jgi:hypothetical protein
MNPLTNPIKKFSEAHTGELYCENKEPTTDFRSIDAQERSIFLDRSLTPVTPAIGQTPKKHFDIIAAAEVKETALDPITKSESPLNQIDFIQNHLHEVVGKVHELLEQKVFGSDSLYRSLTEAREFARYVRRHLND